MSKEQDPRDSGAGRRSRATDDIRRNRRAHLDALLKLAGVYKDDGDIDVPASARQLYSDKGAKSYPYKLIKESKEGIDQEETGVPYWATSDWVEVWKLLIEQIITSTSEDEIALSRLPRPYEFYELLLYFIQLTHEERKILNIEGVQHQSLVERALINVLREPDPYKVQHMVEALYKATIGINLNTSARNRITDKTEDPWEIVRIELKSNIDNLLRSNFGREYLTDAKRIKLNDYLMSKCMSEISRIMVESGALHGGDIEKYIDQYLTPELLHRLPLVIDSNERINAFYPVHLLTYDLECCGPLPLRIREESNNISDTEVKEDELLCASLLSIGIKRDQNHAITFGNEDKEAEEIAHILKAGLHLQHGFEMRIDFQIKPFDDDQSARNSTKSKTKSEQKITNFSIRGRGMGGQTALAHRLINVALLSHMPSLENYFPIARDKFMQQEVVGRRTTGIVHSHVVVQLCEKEALAKALKEIRQASKPGDSLKRHYKYEYYYEFSPTGQSDYIGFSVPLTTMRAKTLATLDAIRSARITPKIYTEELINKVRVWESIPETKAQLTAYPFSILMAEDHLKNSEYYKVLENELSPLKESGEIPKNKLGEILKKIPSLYFEAVLFLIHEQLNEGYCQRAHGHLNLIKTVLKHLSNENAEEKTKDSDAGFHIFSASILAGYELEEARAIFFSSSDTSEVSNSWEALCKADNHLKIRQLKYQCLGESAQSVFSSYYDLKAQIAFTRFQLLFYASIHIEDYELKNKVPKLLEGKFIESKRKPLEVTFSQLHWLEKLDFTPLLIPI
ncbi:MAG: hypothetical protein HC921_16680 [Synechococcaceae cyanobacterium SM2_3_1]|nr:hypothetical protein [Synechococcaceae cyanobacterium SM2_3_1]